MLYKSILIKVKTAKHVSAHCKLGKLVSLNQSCQDLNKKTKAAKTAKHGNHHFMEQCSNSWCSAIRIHTDDGVERYEDTCCSAADDYEGSQRN